MALCFHATCPSLRNPLDLNCHGLARLGPPYDPGWYPSCLTPMSTPVSAHKCVYVSAHMHAYTHVCTHVDTHVHGRWQVDACPDGSGL